MIVLGHSQRRRDMQKIVTLSNGTEVECQAVSVYLAIDVAHRLKIVEPIAPEKNIFPGSAEKIAYGEDDDAPEWLAYKVKLADYEDKNDQFTRSFHWYAGVIRWKLPGSKKFVSTPPKDWTMPPIVQDLNMFTPALDPRRIAYIKYELLVNAENLNAVFDVIYGGTLLSSTEVDDAVNSFPN